MKKFILMQFFLAFLSQELIAQQNTIRTCDKKKVKGKVFFLCDAELMTEKGRSVLVKDQKGYLIADRGVVIDVRQKFVTIAISAENLKVPGRAPKARDFIELVNSDNPDDLAATMSVF
tara:strand:- start:650 stop:1003 length:354 start_codon:yes stop_codon:yes gene_type:complete